MCILKGTHKRYEKTGGTRAILTQENTCMYLDSLLEYNVSMRRKELPVSSGQTMNKAYTNWFYSYVYGVEGDV